MPLCPCAPVPRAPSPEPRVPSRGLDLPQASSYLDGHAEVVSLLELFCSIGFHSPGTTLGGGGMGGMGKRMGGMSRASAGGVGSLNASCTDLASLG